MTDSRCYPDDWYPEYICQCGIEYGKFPPYCLNCGRDSNPGDAIQRELTND